MLRISCFASGWVVVLSLVACSGSTGHGGNGTAGAGGSAAGTGGSSGAAGAPPANGAAPSTTGGSPSGNGGGGANAGGPSTSGGNGNGGNGNGGNNNGGSGSVSIDEFPAAMAKASCSRIFECCTDDELAMAPILTSEPQCQQLFQGFATQLIAPLKTSLAAGRAEFDSAELAQCLMAYTTTSCDVLRKPDTMLEGCETFVTPKVALNGACAESYECIQGYCAESGTCQPKKTNGSPCADEDDECQSDFCDEDTCGAPPVGSGGLCDL